VGNATRTVRRGAAAVRHRNRFGGWRGRLAALACAIVLGLAPATALAQESTGESAGYGIGAALCSLVYAPVKIVYAVTGGLIGGFAWLLSAGDSDVADAVITPAVRGDYVVTPAILRGERPLEFIGRPPAPSYAPPPPQPQSY
jgi:hypothetical protein